MDIRDLALGIGGSLLAVIGLAAAVWAVIGLIRRAFSSAERRATLPGLPRLIGVLLIGLAVIAAGVFLFMVI